MKFVATRDLFRVPAMADIEISNPVNPRHIHKGAQFEIGKGDQFERLLPRERDLVALLAHAGAVAEATPENIARIEAEIADEKRREATTAKRNEAATNASLAAQLAAVLQQVAAPRAR